MPALYKTSETATLSASATLIGTLELLWKALAALSFLVTEETLRVHLAVGERGGLCHRPGLSMEVFASMAPRSWHFPS